MPTLEEALKQAESYRRLLKTGDHWIDDAPYAAEMVVLADRIKELEADQADLILEWYCEVYEEIEF